MPNANVASVIRGEGWLKLWKGNGVNCIRVFPQTAITFSAYNHINERFKGNKAVNAGIAGAIAITATYPFETVRSRLSLQYQNNYYDNMRDAFRKMTVRDYYRGLGVSIVGYPIYTGISFAIYEYFRNNKPDANGIVPINNNATKLTLGGLAGAGALMVSYPTDVVRRRLQMQGLNETGDTTTISQCVKQLFRTDGIRGFYRGLGWGIVKIIPASAIQFWTYDRLISLYNRRNNIY